MHINAVDLTANGNTFGHNIANNNGGAMEISVEGLTLTNNIIHHLLPVRQRHPYYLVKFNFALWTPFCTQEIAKHRKSKE